MKELGVLICDRSRDEAKELSDKLTELMSSRYTGSIRLRFHYAQAEVPALQLIEDYKESLALIVIDLAFKKEGIDEYSTTISSALNEFEVKVIRDKATDTKICYVGSDIQVEEAGFLLRRAYDTKKYDYSPPPQLLHRQDDRSLDVLASQAMSFATVTSSKLESKLEELEGEVFLINQKLFIQDPTRTQSPPMSQMILDHTRLIGSSQKDIAKIYGLIDDINGLIEELKEFAGTEFDSVGGRIGAVEEEVRQIQTWRDGLIKFRRIFVSLDGGWFNEWAKAAVYAGGTALAIKIYTVAKDAGWF